VRPRHLFLASLAGLILLLLANMVSVFAASNPLPNAGKIGQQSQAVVASQLKPSECTGTVSSIVTVVGTQSFSGANVLVLGSSGVDQITQNAAGAGYACFVGGAGNDVFTGRNGAGDECVVSTGDPAANITRCTIVARRP
jgi:hypothetical protein